MSKYRAEDEETGAEDFEAGRFVVTSAARVGLSFDVSGDTEEGFGSVQERKRDDPTCCQS